MQLVILRNVAADILRSLQNMSLYRRLGRRAAPFIEVRRATNADILAVQHWFTLDAESSSIAQCDVNVTNWVACCQERFAGFVQLVRQADVHSLFAGHWLFGLYVKPYFRGLGIGESLCQAVIECARHEAAPTLNLLVYEDNYRAIYLYRKLGFNMLGFPKLLPLLENERISSGRRQVIMSKIVVALND